MNRNLGIAAVIWGASVLVSRLIGLVREAVIGRLLGAGPQADVYHAAFQIPEFLNYLVAGGALTLVLIPVIARHLERGDEAASWRTLSVVGAPLGLGLVSVTAVLVIFAPYLVPIVAPGFSSDQQLVLVRITRIVLPSQVFHVLGGLLSAALQARDRHTLPAMAPLVYAVGTILGGVIGGATSGAEGFAWGVLAGSAAGPFGLPLFGCWRLGYRPWPAFDLRHPDLRRYLVDSIPIMLGVSIVVVDDWMLRRQGSLIGTGTVAVVAYAKTLLRVPVGIFGLAAGAATYPTLSRLVASGDRAKAYATVTRAIRLVVVLAMFGQTGLLAGGAALPRVIYGARVSAPQHEAIALTLAICSLGLWAWACHSLASRGLYALGRTWLSTIIGSVVTIAAIPMYVGLGRAAGLRGLAAASAIAITVYAISVLEALRRSYGAESSSLDARLLLRAAAATVAGVAAGRGVLWLGGSWLPLVQLAAAGLASGVVFVAVAWAVRLEEVRDLLRLVRRRSTRSE